MNKLKFFIITFALCLSSFTVFSAMTATPAITNFKQGKVITGTITIDSDKRGTISGISSNSGKAIATLVSGAGQRSGEYTVTFSEEVINVKITVQYSIPPDTPADEIPNDSTSVGAVSVELTLEDEGFSPSVAPKICINAQTKYKKVKYRAKVKPAGTSAKIKVIEGGIKLSKKAGIQNNEIITVTGQKTGNYQIEIEHNMLASATATPSASVVFELGIESLSLAHGVTVSRPFKESKIGLTEPTDFIANLSVNARRFDNPLNPTINAKIVWIYRMVTVPEKAWIGEVKAKTELKAISSVGQRGSGIIGTPITNAVTAKISYFNKITVSGLTAGNDSIEENHTTVAPFGLLPISADFFVDTTVWFHQSAKYKINKKVNMTVEVQQNIVRTSTVASGSGTVEALGTGVSITNYKLTN